MKTITRQEALQRGLKRYFTGRACSHGHVAERLVSGFVCSECLRLRNQRARARAKTEKPRLQTPANPTPPGP